MGLLAAIFLLGGLESEALAQSRRGRPEHLFTLHGASDRLSFGSLVDICFEPRYREIYVVDSGRNAVWVFDSSGFPLHHFGRGIGLRNPKSVAVSSSGRVFVTTWTRDERYAIRVCDVLGHPLGWFGGEEEKQQPSLAAPEWAAQRFAVEEITPREAYAEQSSAPAPGEGPQQGSVGTIELGPDGFLYVYEVFKDARGAVSVYGLDGSLKRRMRGEAPSGTLAGGMAVRPNGDVLTTDLDRGVVVVYNGAGEEIGTVGQRGGATGKLSFPTDVALSLDGGICVVDRHRHAILVYNPQGQLQYEFGGLGRRDGFFFFPMALCVDDENRLWVVDMSQRVQVFALPGKVRGVVRSGK